MALLNPQLNVNSRKEVAVETALSVDQVAITYPGDNGDVVAVESVSFDLNEAEFLSIVGPSGCGKSTLLMALDGLIPIADGVISVSGKPINKPGHDRAVVFQDASLLPWKNVLQNVRYGLDMRGDDNRSQRDRTAQEFIELVGLTGFERYYPHQLSGGMQQRVNLARALAMQPRVLLLDEPFAALDAQTRELMQTELLRIWSTNRMTTVFITHQLDEAVYLSDRVMVMSKRPGRVVLDQRIELERPRPLSLKREPEFQAIERRLWSVLHEEIDLDAIEQP